jgi:hypothetical protein
MYLILLKSFYRCKDNTFFELSVINWEKNLFGGDFVRSEIAIWDLAKDIFVEGIFYVLFTKCELFLGGCCESQQVTVVK